MVCFMLPELAHAEECGPKTQPQPQPTVTVTSSQELIEAIRAAHGNGPKSIHLRAGAHRVPKRGFVIRADGLNIQGAPGQRDKTIIRGDAMRGNATHVFLVQGKNFQVAHLTLGWVKHHVVQVQGERGASSPRFFDVAFINAGEQLFKVTGRGGTKLWTADGKVIVAVKVRRRTQPSPTLYSLKFAVRIPRRSCAPKDTHQNPPENVGDKGGSGNQCHPIAALLIGLSKGMYFVISALAEPVKNSGLAEHAIGPFWNGSQQ